MFVDAFWKLSRQDKSLMVETLLSMAFIRCMLWLVPFKKVQKFSGRKFKDVPSDVSPGKLIWAVQSVSYYVPRATCLTKALTAQYLLSKNGYQSMVKIGVGKDSEGQFEAHAWLEHAGEVVIGESEKEFVPIFDL